MGLYSTYVRNFKRKTEKSFAFSCPLCGDSKKDPRKARGYVFDKSNISLYKCHNCGVSTTFSNLLKETQPHLYTEYVFEKFGNKLKYEEETSPVEDLFDESPLNIKFLLQNCANLEDKHPAKTYLLNRKIPSEKLNEIYYVDNLNIMKKIFTNYQDTILPKEDRIVFPVYDIRNELIAIISRAINKYSKMRYIILKKDESTKVLFGLEKLDFNQPKYVVEGPIDSLFIPNSVAVSGADLQKCINMFDDNTTYIFDNQPRNREIVSRMKGITKLHKKIFVWPQNIREKDINDAILQNVDIIDCINKHTYKDLRALTEIGAWSKIK